MIKAIIIIQYKKLKTKAQTQNVEQYTKSINDCPTTALNTWDTAGKKEALKGITPL